MRIRSAYFFWWQLAHIRKKFLATFLWPFRGDLKVWLGTRPGKFCSAAADSPCHSLFWNAGNRPVETLLHHDRRFWPRWPCNAHRLEWSTFVHAVRPKMSSASSSLDSLSRCSARRYYANHQKSDIQNEVVRGKSQKVLSHTKDQRLLF